MMYLFFLLLIALGSVSCSWLDSGSNAAIVGARVVAVNTARAGAIAARYIASNTYEGGRKAVTWTGDRTVDGTTATLEMLNIIERPVPPSILERIPEDLLVSLTALEFVSPRSFADRAVISSEDSRWEGEVFYRVNGGALEFEIEGPAELILVTLSTAFSRSDKCLKRYTVVVDEDRTELGRIEFATSPAGELALYSHPGWLLSEPGVFVIKALEGDHHYRIDCDFAGDESYLLVAGFMPRYGTPGEIHP